MAPLLMTEAYWANSMLSPVRYTGRIRAFGSEYIIVDKNGIDIFTLSEIAEREGREKAIPPGEPCDLIDTRLIKAYRRLGRDRIITLLKEGKSLTEINKTKC